MRLLMVRLAKAGEVVARRLITQLVRLERERERGWVVGRLGSLIWVEVWEEIVMPFEGGRRLEGVVDGFWARVLVLEVWVGGENWGTRSKGLLSKEDERAADPLGGENPASSGTWRPSTVATGFTSAPLFAGAADDVRVSVRLNANFCFGARLVRVSCSIWFKFLIA